MEVDQARIPITDEGLMHADGVFEVIRIYDGRPFALSEHLDRMSRSAQTLRLPVDIEVVGSEIEELLRVAHAGDAILRIIATRGGHRIAMLEPLKTFPESIALVTIEYLPPLVLDGVKSLSYAANMLATRRAQDQGGDEALLVTPDGHVLEAPTSSFFYAFDTHNLFTPPLSEHILDSITRRHVIAAAGASERELLREELVHLSEAFIASSVREALPIRAIDNYPIGAPGPLTLHATDAVRKRIASLLL